MRLWPRILGAVLLLAPLTFVCDSSPLAAANESKTEKQEKTDAEQFQDVSTPSSDDEDLDIEKDLASFENNKPVPSEKTIELNLNSKSKVMSRLEIVNFHRELIHQQSYLAENPLEGAADHIDKKYSVNLGMLAYGDSQGQSIWPTIQFHGALSKRYTLGVSSGISSFTFQGLETRAIGATGVLTFYPQNTYDGILGKLGLGFSRYDYRLVGSSDFSSDTVSLNGMAVLGWRWAPKKSSFTLGFEGGITYYSLPNAIGNAFNRSGTVAVSLVLPTFFFDFGFRF